MKRLFTIILSVLPLLASAQESLNVTVDAPGQLEKQIEKDKRMMIGELKVSGPLNNADVKLLQQIVNRTKANAKKGECIVTSIDLSEAFFTNEKGIVAQSQYAKDRKLFGVLETVWHHYRGREFAMMMESSACGAWGHGRTQSGRHQGGPLFATHWRHCGWDMGVKDYSESGFYGRQVTRDALDR